MLLIRLFKLKIKNYKKYKIKRYSYNNNKFMNQKLEKMEVTPEERELLEAVRNYNKSFPDGYPQLLWYAQELFDNLVRQPY